MNEERTYIVEVAETSREITARERVKLKNTLTAVRLDEESRKGEIEIEPDFWATLAVHNEKSEDKDYDQFLVMDTEGTRYITGSGSFKNEFLSIWDDMKDEEEPWSIRVVRMPSKNYAGRDFLTCELV